MPVVPHHAHLFCDRTCLYQFLLACQQSLNAERSFLIASLALEIDPVDPLVVLQDIVDSTQPHFYMEKRATGEAIAAIGAVSSLLTEGKQRFLHAEAFIKNCSTHLIFDSTVTSCATAPYFFCSFSFFDHVTSEDNAAFPAATIFLPRWQIIRKSHSCYVIVNQPLYQESDLDNLTETIWQQLQTICLAKRRIFDLPNDIKHHLNRWEIVEPNHFSERVEAVLAAIHTQRFNKMVLAHAVDVFSQFPLHWIQSLHHLRQLNPDCYVFSTGVGRGQSFIGASPERLLSVHDQTLVTEALAGSAPRGKTHSDDARFSQYLLNSPKERHEHQLVVDFLVQQLACLGLTPQLAQQPGLLQLSNIQHLHTPIRATVPAHLHPLTILADLHPTPAMAGAPRDVACEHIRLYEHFERSLYAAPLGWVDLQGNAEFIVGIRSALISGQYARLYAGAGIVSGSDPARELAEVKLKLQSLLKALI